MNCKNSRRNDLKILTMADELQNVEIIDFAFIFQILCTSRIYPTTYMQCAGTDAYKHTCACKDHFSLLFGVLTLYFETISHLN